MLHSFGVRHSIDLTQPQELSTSGVPIQPYADIAREVGIKPARSAIVDNDIPTASQAREILKYILKAEQDGKVYLHCRGGIGRTGTVACLYLLAKGMAQPHNVLRTLQIMRERYDCWGQSPEFGKQRTFIMRWWTRNAKRYSA
jgi:protein-tyrosine phosphatase